MIKFSKYIVVILAAILVVFSGCEEDNYELGELITPTNLDVVYEVVGIDGENPYGDGSGVVNFSASASNNITFNYIFDDGKDNTIASDGTVSHQFSQNGVNTYNVTVLAVGTGGISASKTVQVEVFSSFKDDEALDFLTGGSSRTWYWAADQPGHVGMGTQGDDYGNLDYTFASWWNAGEYEKECMYDAEFVFTKTEDGLTYEQTTGSAYIPGTYAGVIGVEGDACYGEDVAPALYGVKNVAFSPSSSKAAIDGEYRGSSFSIADGGFMCWWVGTSEYDIIQVTDNLLQVRIKEDDAVAWYHTFTTVKPGEEQDGVDVTYSELVWSDEFDIDGTPDAAKWGYDLGTGDNGWGNGESQYYTNRTDNVTVADGILKITAKAESYEGSNYTSARLLTKDLYDFTYGRVDIKAKLPEGGGTWPALWMLGSNITTDGWPACGELDIMEGVGNNPGHIQSAIHTTSSSGATENMGSTTVDDASSAYHIYSVNWSPNQISFLVDDVVFYTYNPDTKDDATWPFDASQFIILNVAMGGSLGGDIDPDFSESSMEIDYVRVYQ